MRERFVSWLDYQEKQEPNYNPLFWLLVVGMLTLFTSACILVAETVKALIG